MKLSNGGYNQPLVSLISLHPATVHIPIGLLILASASGLIYIWIRPCRDLLILAWWPMLIGWIASLIAILTGIIAQGGLPPEAPYRPTLNVHVTAGLAILLVYGTLLYGRWTQRNAEDERDPLFDSEVRVRRIWVSLLLIMGAILVVWTGWSGGQLVYRWGVNVGADG